MYIYSPTVKTRREANRQSFLLSRVAAPATPLFDRGHINEKTGANALKAWFYATLAG